MTRFPSLDNERGLDREQLQQYFDVLCELHDETDPTKPGTDAEKDLKAQRALMLAQSLFIELAGWAVNHTIGRVLDPELDNDLHEHEVVGRSANSDERLLDSDRARKLLATLMSSSTIPAIVAVPAREGLRALSAGEVQPFYRPASGFRMSAYTLARLRLEAVEQTYFLAVGSKKFVAEERVAAAFGISVETLRKWEKRLLPRALGPRAVEEAIAAAQDAGRYAQAISDDPSAESRIREESGGWPWAHFWLQTGTSMSLAERGRRYQTTLAAVAASEKGTNPPSGDT